MWTVLVDLHFFHDPSKGLPYVQNTLQQRHLLSGPSCPGRISPSFSSPKECNESLEQEMMTAVLLETSDWVSKSKFLNPAPK